MTALEILHDRALEPCRCAGGNPPPCEHCIAREALSSIEGALNKAARDAALLRASLPAMSLMRAQVFRFEQALGIGAELCRAGENISPADDDEEDEEDEDSAS